MKKTVSMLCALVMLFTLLTGIPVPASAEVYTADFAYSAEGNAITLKY